MSHNNLDGRTVLVTGGAIRVGAAISTALASRNVRLAIHCFRHHTEAYELARTLRATNLHIQVVVGDLTEAGQVAKVFDAVDAQLGPIDYLVNNAGLIAETPLASYDPAVAESLFRLNTFAPLATIAELARRPSPRRRAVVNIVDSSAQRAWLSHAAYCASKEALLAITRVAARELAPHIRVNAVNPGVVDQTNHSSAGTMQSILSKIPLGTVGHPDDVAQAVVYLLQAPYVTGAVLDVDGGRHLLA